MNSKDSPSDTPTAEIALVAVHEETRLFRWGATYYFRAKVPEELRPLLKKKEIPYSLKTKDRHEAKRLNKLASQKADAEIDTARRVLEAAKPKPKVATPLSDAEIFYIVAS
jgi:hypothetical protein